MSNIVGASFYGIHCVNRGPIAKILWPDQAINWVSDKVLMLEVAERIKTVISHWYASLKTVFFMQVAVQSIKWINCRAMYKGYQQVLPHEHTGDPTKCVELFLWGKSDLPKLRIHFQRYIAMLSNKKMEAVCDPEMAWTELLQLYSLNCLSHVNGAAYALPSQPAPTSYDWLSPACLTTFYPNQPPLFRLKACDLPSAWLDHLNHSLWVFYRFRYFLYIFVQAYTLSYCAPPPCKKTKNPKMQFECTCFASH